MKLSKSKLHRLDGALLYFKMNPILAIFKCFGRQYAAP
jgi:hypothetical protein